MIKNSFRKYLMYFFCMSIIFSNYSATKINLTKEIKYSGKIKNTIAYTDKLGEHIIITTGLENLQERKAYIFAYDYLKKPNTSKYILNWKLEDGINESCDVDYTVQFLSEPIITDLNNNNIKEVTLVYIQTCAGDISPFEMKAIKREDKTKYGLRGSSLDVITKENKKDPCCSTKYDEDDYMNIMGLYQNENDFKNAPKEFLQHSRKIWLQYRDISKYILE